MALRHSARSQYLLVTGSGATVSARIWPIKGEDAGNVATKLVVSEPKLAAPSAIKADTELSKDSRLETSSTEVDYEYAERVVKQEAHRRITLCRCDCSSTKTKTKNVTLPTWFDTRAGSML